MMDFPAARDYIYGYIRNSTGGYGKDSAPEVALARIRQLLGLLDNPHERYPIVHITGTKGKGSVSALCASVLQAAGYKTGLYTSPHLQDLRERYKINQALIPTDVFPQIVEQVRPALEAVHKPTFFEAVTALAFAYFAQAQVDVAVIEVGIGGLHDATNAVHPVLSVITSLSMDHMNLLGNTIEEIASEKAGIIKPRVPVVSAPQPPTALAVLEAAAKQQHAPLTLVGRDWAFSATTPRNAAYESFTAGWHDQAQLSYTVPLIGAHQVINSVVTLAALDQLTRHGFTITPEAIAAGFAAVKWPGRMEVLRRTGCPTVVLDAAHNAASVEYLKQTLLGRFPARPLILVFGAKSTKDIETMLAVLLPITDGLVLTQSTDTATVSPEALAGLAHQLHYPHALGIAATISEALQRAERLAGEGGLVCVTGSVYLVGEARTVYQLAPGETIIPAGQTP
jgi:dihydrofolate synthase/folylpolyglutamate synthase